MIKIAVTGCAGFIGSQICDKLLQEGYGVVGIDNLSSGVNYTPAQVEFHHVDVNSDIKDILAQTEGVIHASAYAELRHNWHDKSERDKLFANNEMATRSVLEQMPNVPIIFLSSGSVYGSISNNKISDRPLVEEDCSPEFVESPYAASKLACEAYVAAWSHKRQVPWYALRLVNQVGARGHRGVIADFVRMAQQNKHIHAADNGKQTKNWVNVKDTVNAISFLFSSEVPSGIYNITSTERWSWRDIVDIMLKMHKEKYPHLKEDPFKLTHEVRLAGSVGDPINLYVSGEKLKPYFNCNSSVEQAVREALLFLGWTK
jgi:UDP-glucose 4-epimerase